MQGLVYDFRVISVISVTKNPHDLHDLHDSIIVLRDSKKECNKVRRLS